MIAQCEETPPGTSHDLHGVCRCNVGALVDLSGWSEELSKVTPLSIFAEDQEYAQYRNILEDDVILLNSILCAEKIQRLQHYKDKQNLLT